VTDGGRSVELEYLQERTLVRPTGEIDLSNINQLQLRLELTIDGRVPDGRPPNRASPNVGVSET
jgi:hypothetical protein